MATGDVAVGEPGTGSSTVLQTPASKRIINDFSIQVATVNGSGSQSANLVLLKSIFGMGIPVSGKNLFPSNIAGLPTWYTIRASKEGYVARKRGIELLVAMNAETAKEDILSLPEGAAAIYDVGLDLKQYRDDVVCYPVPFDKLTAAVCPEAKLRKLVRNMIYVGVVAQLLSMDMTAVEQAVRRQFARKQKAADLNWAAIKAGFEFAATALTKQDSLQLQSMNGTAGKIIIDGNAAAALGAMFAGVTVVTWYPITPSSSVVESLIDFMKKHRIEESGKATFAIVQAEDELAAVGMVLGAGWAGARSMTSTSGPGISLMAEFAGLGYFAELPGVIFDIRKWKQSTKSKNVCRIDVHLLRELKSRDLTSFRRDELQDFLHRKSKGRSFSVVNHLRWDLKQIFNMAVLGGMRPGEICALRWCRIGEDFAEVAERVYQGVLDTPKRIIHIARWLCRSGLLRIWDGGGSCRGGPDGFVFPSERGTPISNQNVYTQSAVELRLPLVNESEKLVQ